MKKRFLSLALVLVLALSLLPTGALAAGLTNFQKVNDDFNGKFTDVPAGTWYTESVQTAYELGLVQGSGPDTFTPDGNITIGSALALACRLHSIYTIGAADFVQGSPWYAVYVDYAVDNGIITVGQFNDYNANATRRQFAAILAKALPAEALNAINTIEDGQLPDVPAGSANAADIYALYRAGILTGNDAYGTFTPETPIGRSSVAAIVARMAVPALRRSITLEKPPVLATGISLSKTSLGVNVGGSATLTATVSPADAADKTVTWSSSNPAVATVSNGTVTGVANGSATITATTSNGLSAVCSVTVAQMGTLSNPLPADGQTTIQYNRYKYLYAAQNIKIECLGELKGAAANALAKAENRNNPEPNANQEYRFYEFNITYVSAADGSELKLRARDIIDEERFFTTSGSKPNTYRYSATLGDHFGGQDVFDVTLYPGTSGKVVIGVLVDQVDGDLLLQVPYDGGDKNTWLLLNPGTTGSLDVLGSSSGGNSGTGDGYKDDGSIDWDADVAHMKDYYPDIPDFGTRYDRNCFSVLMLDEEKPTMFLYRSINPTGDVVDYFNYLQLLGYRSLGDVIKYVEYDKGYLLYKGNVNIYLSANRWYIPATGGYQGYVSVGVTITD